MSAGDIDNVSFKVENNEENEATTYSPISNDRKAEDLEEEAEQEELPSERPAEKAPEERLKEVEQE